MTERAPAPPPGGFGANAPRADAPYAHAHTPGGGGGSGVVGIVIAVVVVLVAGLGVLSTLAIHGMRKYLAVAKTAEAQNTLRAIGRSAAAAHQRDGRLCPSVSHPIPSSPEAIRGRKYMSTASEWQTSGFECLKFEMNTPQYYTYEYTSAGDTFTAIAHGDLNGDGRLSTWIQRGRVEGGAVVLDPLVESIDPQE